MAPKKLTLDDPIISRYEAGYKALEEAQEIYPLVFSETQATKLLQEYIGVQVSGVSSTPLRTIPIPGRRRFTISHMENSVRVMSAIVDKILSDNEAGALKRITVAIQESAGEQNLLAETRLRIFARIAELRKQNRKNVLWLLTRKSGMGNSEQGAMVVSPLADPTYSSAVLDFKHRIQQLQQNRPRFRTSFERRLREVREQKEFVTDLENFEHIHSRGEYINLDVWYAFLKKHNFELVDRFGNTVSPNACLTELGINDPTIENLLAYIAHIFKRALPRNASSGIRGAQARIQERRRIFENRLQELRSSPEFLVEMGELLSYSSKRKANFYQRWFELCKKYELLETAPSEKYHPQAYYTSLFGLENRKHASLTSYVLRLAPELHEHIPKKERIMSARPRQTHASRNL